MEQAFFDGTANLVRLRLLRLVSLLGVLAYPLYWPLHRALMPGSVDPLWPRLAISGLCLLLLAGTFVRRSFVERYDETLLAALGAVLAGHMLFLAYANDLNPYFTAAVMAIFACLSVLLNSPVAVLWLALGTLALSFLGVLVQPVGTVFLIASPLAFLAVVSVAAAGWRWRTQGALARALAKLRESEERFRHMAGTLPVMLWTTDAEGRTTYVNPLWCQYTGRTSHDFGASGGRELVHPDDLALTTTTYERALAARRSFEVEFRLKRADGVYRWLQVNGSPRFGPAGRLEGYTCSGLDITPRIEAQEALAQSGELYRAITEAALDGILTVADDGTILLANSAAAALFDSTPAELIGQPLARYVPGIDGLKELSWVRQGPGGRRHLEARFAAATRRDRRLLVGFVRDVSDRVKAGEEQARLQNRVAVSAQLAALGEMAAGIAHEISNPLTILTGQAVRLGRAIDADQVDVETLRQTAETIRQTTDRMAGIVHGMRTLSRQGRYQDPFKRSELLDTVDDAVAMVRESYRAAHVELRVDVPDGVALACRPTQISQVLVNLLANARDAVKALGEGERWVEVAGTDRGDAVEVAVSDGGRGLPPELQDKVFQPFFTTKQVGEGTGLGLSISRAIVEVHGGTIRVDDARGHTCFVVTLPKAPPRLPL